jgi:hypothetical protein
VLTHVLDKNDPAQIVQGLKKKKSVEVVESEKLKDGDYLVSFVKFDMPNLKVQNNLCRIKKDPHQGSIVFQYIDTKRMKSQSEGAPFTDFTQVSEKVKELPLDSYMTAYSESRSYRPVSDSHIPWYKRPNARAGAGTFQY